MTAFEATLTATVRGLEEGYSSALADLQAEVQEASRVVLGITHQRASLEVRKTDESPCGAYYELRLVFETRYFEVAGFLLSPSGYPIRAGRNVMTLRDGEYEIEIPDQAQLQNYFLRMAQNRDSSLVLRVSLLMRSIGGKP